MLQPAARPLFPPEQQGRPLFKEQAQQAGNKIYGSPIAWLAKQSCKPNTAFRETDSASSPIQECILHSNWTPQNTMQHNLKLYRKCQK